MHTENNTERKGYFKMNNSDVDLLGPILGPRGLGFLAYFRRRASKNGISFASLERIRKDLGVGSFNTIKKYMNLLRDNQVLKAWKENGKWKFQVIPIGISHNENAPFQIMKLKEEPKKENPIKETSEKNTIRTNHGLEKLHDILKRDYPEILHGRRKGPSDAHKKP